MAVAVDTISVSPWISSPVNHSESSCVDAITAGLILRASAPLPASTPSSSPDCQEAEDGWIGRAVLLQHSDQA